VTPTFIPGSPTLVVNSTGDEHDADPFDLNCVATSGFCTLRAAIEEANNYPGPNTITFDIPESDPHFNSTRWRIVLSSDLPAITDGSLDILGFTQTTNQRDSNSGYVGTGGTVGVEAEPLPTYARPEIAIDGGGNTAVTISGTASNVLIEGMAIYNSVNGVVIQSGSNSDTIRYMLIGTLASGLDPGAQRNSYRGIDISDCDGVTITSNYIGYNGRDAIRASGDGAHIEITYNEIFENGWNSNFSDGVHLDGMIGTVQYNLIRDNTNASTTPQRGSGGGVEIGPQFAVSGWDTVENNTIRGNLSAGVSMRSGATGDTISLNSIVENEVGVSVNDEATGATNANTITQNQMGSNAALGIDLNDGSASPDFDGVTLNDYNDTDTGSNELLNFPVMYNAVVSGSDIIVTGEARPGATIEFFRTDNDDSGYGEGDVFLGAYVEDGPDDINDGTGLIDDTAEAFTFAIPDGGTIPGDTITATATDSSGNTSEFAENIVVEPEFYPGFQYRQQITVSTTTEPVDVGYSVSVSFDHETLVTAGQAQPSGDDVRLFYWDGGGWYELDRILDPLSSWNNPATELWFALQNPIEADSSDSWYYLYYGDPLALDPPADWATVFPTGDAFDDDTLAAELTADVAGATYVEEASGVAAITGGTQETDAGIIINTAPLSASNQFAVQHQVTITGGIAGSEAEMLAVVESNAQPTVDDAEVEDPRRRIVVTQRVDDGEVCIFYMDTTPQTLYWDGAQWTTDPLACGSLGLASPAVYELYGDGTAWWIDVLDGSGAVLTTTQTDPVPWSSLEDSPSEDYWLYWGEVYTDQFWASTASDWFHLRDFVDPEPTTALADQMVLP
jgi:CSLREA domain-containing protein